MDQSKRGVWTPTDELTPLIGMVARAGGMLEESARVLHGVLVSSGAARPLRTMGPGCATYLQKAVESVAGWAESDESREAATAALTAALAANKRRSDVVHGLWAIDGEGYALRGPGGINMQEKWGREVRANDFTVDDLVSIAEQIARADLRVQGLCWWSGSRKATSACFYSDCELERLIRGEFRLHGFRHWSW